MIIVSTHSRVLPPPPTSSSPYARIGMSTSCCETLIISDSGMFPTPSPRPPAVSIFPVRNNQFAPRNPGSLLGSKGPRVPSIIQQIVESHKGPGVPTTHIRDLLANPRSDLVPDITFADSLVQGAGLHSPFPVLDDPRMPGPFPVPLRINTIPLTVNSDPVHGAIFPAVPYVSRSSPGMDVGSTQGQGYVSRSDMPSPAGCGTPTSVPGAPDFNEVHNLCDYVFRSSNMPPRPQGQYSEAGIPHPEPAVLRAPFPMPASSVGVLPPSVSCFAPSPLIVMSNGMGLPPPPGFPVQGIPPRPHVGIGPPPTVNSVFADPGDSRGFTGPPLRVPGPYLVPSTSVVPPSHVIVNSMASGLPPQPFLDISQPPPPPPPPVVGSSPSNLKPGQPAPSKEPNSNRKKSMIEKMENKAIDNDEVDMAICGSTPSPPRSDGETLWKHRVSARKSSDRRSRSRSRSPRSSSEGSNRFDSKDERSSSSSPEDRVDKSDKKNSDLNGLSCDDALDLLIAESRQNVVSTK